MWLNFKIFTLNWMIEHWLNLQVSLDEVVQLLSFLSFGCFFFRLGPLGYQISFESSLKRVSHGTHLSQIYGNTLAPPPPGRPLSVINKFHRLKSRMCLQCPLVVKRVKNQQSPASNYPVDGDASKLYLVFIQENFWHLSISIEIISQFIFYHSWILKSTDIYAFFES